MQTWRLMFINFCLFRLSSCYTWMHVVVQDTLYIYNGAWLNFLCLADYIRTLKPHKFLFIFWPMSQQAGKNSCLFAPLVSAEGSDHRTPACTGGPAQVPHPLTMTDPRRASDVCSSLLWDLRYVIHKPFPVLLGSISSLNIQIKFRWGVPPVSPVWSQHVRTSMLMHLLHSTWLCLLS